MADAIQLIPGTTPDRASYQAAVETAQDMVTRARNVATGADDLAGVIGRAIPANLQPPRRPRVCVRRVKSPLSRWNEHPPRTGQRITAITAEIHTRHPTAATRRGRRAEGVGDAATHAAYESGVKADFPDMPAEGWVCRGWVTSAHRHRSSRT